MPCFEMVKVKSKISTKNFRLILEASDSLGFSYELKGKLLTIKTKSYDYFRFDIGEENVEYSQNAEKEYFLLKRKYAEKLIQHVSKKKRWALSGSGNSFSVRRY